MKGVVVLALLLLIPLAYSISIKDLIARYSFSTTTSQMNVTTISDFMIDKNNNGINETLVFELTTSNTAGNFVFVLNLFDKNGVLTNETNRTLNSGANKLNITFDSVLLSQSQLNYSIKVYNSTYSLKYRKDDILTGIYSGYEEGFRLLGINDAKLNKTLMINLTINSSLNGTFETALFLMYNDSVISKKENKSITSSAQQLILNFRNETIKLTHYTGKFNISSIKIGKKIIKTNFTTGFYDFRDFAVKSHISDFTDNGSDTNGNNKYDILQINASLQIMNDNAYTVTLALYDLFDSVAEIKNFTSFLNAGNKIAAFNFNGSKIYEKKLNGPFMIKYIELYEDGALIDKINDAYTTGNYNFNDFDNPSLPDLKVNISVSDGYHYGINNITINFTFKNTGNSYAFNVFTDIFDNRTFSRSNKSNVLNINSEIKYQINFTNISDFEVTAIADLQDFVEESNESNNAERVAIKLNKRPNLEPVTNITVNETDKIIISLSATDPNDDNLLFSINFSKFSNKSSIFEWITSTIDSGNYTLSAVASDGFLNNSRIFKIIVLDVPHKDVDNDGINDSIDKLIGDEKSINTSTINLTIFLGNSKNLSRLLNESMKVKFTDNDLAIAEFDFDFSLHKLNLTNITIDKQTANETGSLIFRGLKMPDGLTKALYVDRINTALNGVCIKDEEISSINEISNDCSSNNEFQAECDGTLQNSYICAYNSTLNKYKIQGLKHSGIVQIDYTKPADSGSSSTSSGSSSGGGGGGGVVCSSNWQCGEWAQCINGFRTRKCLDKNQCAFPDKKPAESEQCAIEGAKKASLSQTTGYADKIRRTNDTSSKFTKFTGQAVRLPAAKSNFGIFVVLAVALVIIGSYFAVKNRFFLKIFK